MTFLVGSLWCFFAYTVWRNTRADARMSAFYAKAQAALQAVTPQNHAHGEVEPLSAEDNDLFMQQSREANLQFMTQEIAQDIQKVHAYSIPWADAYAKAQKVMSDRAAFQAEPPTNSVQ